MKNYKRNAAYRGALLLALVVALFTGAIRAQEAPQITVRAERENALYQQGEEVTFIVRLTAGVLPAGEVQWKLSKDNYTTIAEGKATLENGEAKIIGKLNEPGFLQCRVSYGKEFKLAGAGVEPLQIKPSLPVPDDFDAFWQAQKKRLAAVPMNAALTPVEKWTNEKIETFDLKADAVGEAPVSGYYIRPRGAARKSSPAILTVHGAGVLSSSASTNWANQNMISLDSPQYTPGANESWLPRLRGIFEPRQGKHHLENPHPPGLGSAL